MTNFGNQLQNYAQGNSEKCQHPIKSVDDNNFCHACNIQIKAKSANTEADQLRSKIDEQAATIARLTAANEAMQEDAVQNTYAFNLMLTANKAQAEDIRTLKQELETIKSCKHMHVKIHSRLYRPSTREEPAEYEYKAECKDCGELFSADDVDE